MELQVKLATKAAGESSLMISIRKIEHKPFLEEILAMKRPNKFKIPHFKIFKGAGDPIEHIW